MQKDGTYYGVFFFLPGNWWPFWTWDCSFGLKQEEVFFIRMKSRTHSQLFKLLISYMIIWFCVFSHYEYFGWINASPAFSCSVNWFSCVLRILSENLIFSSFLIDSHRNIMLRVNFAPNKYTWGGETCMYSYMYIFCILMKACFF